MTKASTSGITARPQWAGALRPKSVGPRLLLAGFMGIGLAGCAGTPSSPTVPSALPSVSASAIASPTSTTPTLTPSPSPTLRPLSFVATGSMHTAREGATATLLKNGKVLIAGGDDSHDVTNTYYASAEIYDPATGKFTTTGSMTAARAAATAVLLSDGRLLIAGGQGCSDPKHCTNIQSGATEDLVSADIYDPTTGKFTRTGSMTDITQNSAAVLLPDGKVLVVGQANFWGQLYDPATGKFVRTGKVAGFTVPINATLLRDGKVLAIGDGVAQIYDEASGKFTTISLAPPRPYTATLLPNGRVLLFEGGHLVTCHPAAGTCADAGFISPGGEWVYPRATLLPDGRVLFEGGALVPDQLSGSVSTNTAVLYDPSSRQVSTGSMQVARAGQTATLLLDGSVLITGGEDVIYKPLASAELFKP
jgi:phage baseplate assembly protein gpV